MLVYIVRRPVLWIVIMNSPTTIKGDSESYSSRLGLAAILGANSVWLVGMIKAKREGSGNLDQLGGILCRYRAKIID